jgi:hypothetical protein
VEEPACPEEFSIEEQRLDAILDLLAKGSTVLVSFNGSRYNVDLDGFSALPCDSAAIPLERSAARFGDCHVLVSDSASFRCRNYFPIENEINSHAHILDL